MLVRLFAGEWIEKKARVLGFSRSLSMVDCCTWLYGRTDFLACELSLYLPGTIYLKLITRAGTPASPVLWASGFQSEPTRPIFLRPRLCRVSYGCPVCLGTNEAYEAARVERTLFSLSCHFSGNPRHFFGEWWICGSGGPWITSIGNIRLPLKHEPEVRLCQWEV